MAVAAAGGMAEKLNRVGRWERSPDPGSQLSQRKLASFAPCYFDRVQQLMCRKRLSQIGREAHFKRLLIQSLVLVCRHEDDGNRGM